MPKRKSQRSEINEPTNKKSLNEITGIDENLTELLKVDKELQTQTKEINENDFFAITESHFLLLDKLANNLELNEFINENLEGDEIDGFREKIKEIVEKIFEEIKGNINSQNPTKKGKFVKVLIKIFSILLTANISSVKK